MKRGFLVLVLFAMTLGCSTTRLPYEDRKIFDVAAEVLDLPDFKDGNPNNEAVLEKRFPLGSTVEEAWKEVMKIRRKHLYATAVFDKFTENDFTLHIFRYTRNELLPLTESISIGFRFNKEGKLREVGYTHSTDDT